MKSKTCLINASMLALALCGLQAWAGKPPSGGGGDTVPPAQISDLVATPTLHAITLKFTTTGNNGYSGTAAGYDVRYREGIDCDSGSPSAWVPAARSSETKAKAPGSIEYFNIRGPDTLASHGLQPGTDYCVAIALYDAVPNYAAWARAPVRTLGFTGDWPLTALAVARRGATQQVLVPPRVFSDADQQLVLAGWNSNDMVITASSTVGALRFARLQNDSVGHIDGTEIPECGATPGGNDHFFTDCIETIPNAVWRNYIEDAGNTTATFAHVPTTGEDVVAFFVSGVKTGSRTKQNKSGTIGGVIVQRDTKSGQWFVVGAPAAPYTPYTYEPSLGSKLAYVQRGEDWYPLLLWSTVAFDTSTYQKAVLNLSERKPEGWTPPVVLSTRETGGGRDIAAAFWRQDIINKPDGTLAVLVKGIPDATYTTYAEPTSTDGPPRSWTWHYLSIDPRHTDQTIVGFDGGKLALANSLYQTSQISIFRQADNPWSVAASTTPLPSYNDSNQAPLETLGSWSIVYSDYDYDNSVTYPSVYASGVVPFAGCGQVDVSSVFGRWSSSGSGSAEQRVLRIDYTDYPDHTDYSASNERIDATEGIVGTMLTRSDGNETAVYDWSYASRQQYKTLPRNYIYLARNPTGCPPQ